VVAATVLTVFDAAPSTRAGPYASGGFSAGPFLSCAPSFYEDSSGNCIEDLISTRTATLVSAAMALAHARAAPQRFMFQPWGVCQWFLPSGYSGDPGGD
jgi:hypothetical protein